MTKNWRTIAGFERRDSVSFMGQLRNAEHNVTINEVTVSHRATKNSPHDALTWDIQGIRGVTMDGGHWYSNDSTVVRSVNVTFDGVSFECDAGMLDVLADPVVRKELVEKSLAAQREKDALEKSPHEWVEAEDKRTEHAAAWQCSRCHGWVVGPTNLERPQGGCIGRPPTELEKRQNDAQVAIQALGRRLQALHEEARHALQNGAGADEVLALAQQANELKRNWTVPLPGATAEETAANYVAHAKATETPEAN